MTESWEAIVVGAGPAGSSAAAVLAERGRRVLVLEKERFPRAKVCGEYLSADAFLSLDRLGARSEIEELRPERISRGSIHPPLGKSVSFQLPAAGFGISRPVLDDLLARRAADAGARVRFETRVTSIERTAALRFRVRAVEGGNETELDASAVIGAWGRWDALDRSLDRGFAAKPGRFFGWNRDYVGDSRFLAGEVRLYLFPGGYCGLSRIEGGKVNLAGIISEKSFRRAGNGWEDACRHARSSNPSLDADLSALEPGPAGFLGTGPVFFTAKPPVENGILMAGDGAGVIDPFSGEGQAAALASGVLAGETVESFLRGEITAKQLPRAYSGMWRRRFSGRFRWSARLRILMLHPTVGQLAGRIAGERLVHFGIAATRNEL